MKVHLITVLIVDHDNLGAAEAGEVLENANYPNDCICPRVLRCETSATFEWSDDHPLNMPGWEAYVAVMFNKPPPEGA